MQNVQQLENEIQRLKIAVEELSVLNDLAIAASSSLEVRQMLDIIVQKSIKAVKAEQGSISLVTAQEDTPFRTLIRQVDLTHDHMPYRIGAHITGWILKNKKSLMIENLATDQRFQASEQEQKEIRSVLCVPIWSQAKIIGILMMMNKKTQEPFNADDLRLLSIIAAQSGQLIRNSQLQEEAIQSRDQLITLQHELDIARIIQLSMLPKKFPAFPDRKEFDIYAEMIPAKEVGGDFYDFFLIDQNRLGFAIGDVSGKGIPAALFMAVGKTVLKTTAMKGLSPEECLQQVNRMLHLESVASMFVTVFYGILNLTSGIVTYANGGHLPPYKISKNGTVTAIDTTGNLALGLLESAVYESKSIHLQPGDCLVLFSDGITEAQGAHHLEFGEERLMHSLNQPIKSAQDTAQAILTDVKTFCAGRTQSDDMTVLVLHFLPNSSLK